LISLLDCSKNFTKLERNGKVIRYEALYRDQFEKKNNDENQYPEEKGLPTLPQSDRHVAVNTIL
jgi:hypothetical protein